MENLLKEFNVDHKNPSEDALRRWRTAVTIVKNRTRRFRMVADLAKRSEAERKRRSIQEKIRVALYVQKAALQFIDAAGQPEYRLSEEATEAGFGIDPDELSSIMRGHDMKRLKLHGGVEGIAIKVAVNLEEGISTPSIPARQKIYGLNQFTEKPARIFLMFVWEALHDLTLIILMICAAVSIGVGIATEGWPSGMYDGLGIFLSIFLVVTVTAISDYKQSLQFRDLDREKRKIFVHVTRDGCRGKVSIYDLVVGDIVHLSIGNQVPADGIFISGYSLLIDESSLSGESEPVNVYDQKPFLLSGTKVQDGAGKMLVTTVGMKTEWGKLMETLSEGGDDETPLQVKLNGVATVIGKIGLGFAVLTFIVLTARFLVEKALRNEITDWSSADALILLNYFAIAITIIVVAVPEGLPLAVTLSLAFAMKKLMNDWALVRHLSACETMGSASCICTDKTGTLTTNHMVVTKIWLCCKSKEIKGMDSIEALKLETAEGVLKILLQAILQNTASEVVKDKDGKQTILGTPTESALLEFGLSLGGDFDGQRQAFKVLKVEPFSSVRKKMSMLVARPDGGVRAFCKGASEIILRLCDKIVNKNGEPVPLSEDQVNQISHVINDFACEALRTLCLAYKDMDEGAIEDRIPESGYTLIIVVGIRDPVRPGVKEAVQTCLAAGITVRMVTGDNINTAKAIARECGILTEDGIAIEGQDFRSKSPEQMKEIIPRIQVMARSLPLDKHTLVTHLRKMFNEVVAVTGDGTNDAPALHEADIGLAMGIAGTEVAKESADVIILNDDFTTIVNVTKWGRAIYINIQKFVQFQLTVNVVALVINFVSACISGSAPLTAVQLLWVNMIMDTLGALALATEPPNDELMKRPPVGKGTSFITKAMWRNIIGQSIYQLAVLGVLNFDGKELLGLHGSDSTGILNTVIFNTFVFCQVFNEIMRSGGFLNSALIALFYVTVLAGLLHRFPVSFSQQTAGQLRSRKSAGVGGAKASDQGETITFADVAGVDEAKEELEEIVEFLRNPDRYIRLGARPPRGVLLVGLPGTGKTLLAKAVAGEADVPFISCSASEFVELYVGMGASRVRDLFARAKKEAPSIIFIDEIDAVAKSRDGKFRIVSNDEREQTLNQLLTEMDGFDSNSAVIVLGATNRSDVLDPALRRPGRFDRIVMVEAPDKTGRETILKVHVTKKELPLAEDVELSDIASMTTGFTGADLANLVNEAALLAGRQNKIVVEKIDFIQAVERSIAGIEKKTAKLKGSEKAVVARHEAGHAVVGTAVANLLPGQPRVEKLSILPRSGGALGFTYIPPTNEDRYLLFIDELRGRLVTLLGGRAAEEVVYSGRVSTGALDDIRRATDMAYKAVAEYGLNQTIGPLSLATLCGGGMDDSGGGLTLGRDQGHLVDLVQREVKALLQSALDVALCVIRANPAVLEGLGAQLEEKEKVEGEELQQWLNSVVTPAELQFFIRGSQTTLLPLQTAMEISQ